MTYRVVRQLSGGGFSDVFQVEDPASALPERLILKRLNAQMSARPEVRQAFAEEAKILRELRHPNIVTFRRCYFDEAQRICLLMEEVAGEPLDVWARRHAGQADRVLDVFEQVLQAVDSLHRRPTPFLHLDLKPDNILVASSPQGPRPVLIDFGIARRSGGKGLKAFTPPYGAPEQRSGGTLDGATDVHALGQILAELLDAVTLPETPARQALADVAARARNPGRRSRFADAGEMGLAFRRACRAASVPAAGLAAGRRWTRLPPRALWSAAAGAALVLFAAGIWLAFSGAEPPREPAASPAATEPAEVGQQFETTVARAREATREGDFERADEHYLQAKQLWESVPAQGEGARDMERDLAALRSQIDLVRHGGIEGERVRLDLK